MLAPADYNEDGIVDVLEHRLGEPPFVVHTILGRGDGTFLEIDLLQGGGDDLTSNLQVVFNTQDNFVLGFRYDGQRCSTLVRSCTSTAGRLESRRHRGLGLIELLWRGRCARPTTVKLRQGAPYCPAGFATCGFVEAR